MAISHRLHSSMDIRPDDGLNEQPKRIVFLSVEGNLTEKNYFSYIHQYRRHLGIETIIYIETLSRRSHDTCSDPESVFELLTDCIEIRAEGIMPDDVLSILNADSSNYSIEYISQYLNGELSNDENKKLKLAIQMAGIDLDYQKFLKDFRGEQNEDIFAVVIDRDRYSHSEESLRELYRKCTERNCYCFITNPCFEFWLLWKSQEQCRT